jgi:SAM-dependent methyltransferase
MNQNTLELFDYGITENNGADTNQHPWILSREKCLLNIINKGNLRNFADIGVNDMYYTKKIRTFAKGNVYAVDIFFPESGLIKDGIICINDISKLPEGEIDCIVMMDVLEYIEDDKGFFINAVKKLKKGGIILLTVPAWQFLFSAHDIRSRHLRRYDKQRLFEVINQENIKIQKWHYFYTILFFTRLMGMLKKEKYAGNEIKWKYQTKNIITQIVKLILDVDFTINKILDKVFIHPPGLSMLAVCKKIN